MGIAGIVVWFETKNNPTFTNMTARQFSNILNLIVESGFHADQRPSGLQKRIIFQDRERAEQSRSSGEHCFSFDA
jgi:hypothetical protein